MAFPMADTLAAPRNLPSVEIARALCADFARRHELTFTERGTCGFGRPCVGLLDGGNYVEWRPLDAGRDYAPVPGFDDDRVGPPPGVTLAYHKHDCLAVLVNYTISGQPSAHDYDDAVRQLGLWVRHLDALGVEVVEYETAATGIQALFPGVTGRAVRVVPCG